MRPCTGVRGRSVTGGASRRFRDRGRGAWSMNMEVQPIGVAMATAEAVVLSAGMPAKERVVRRWGEALAGPALLVADGLVFAAGGLALALAGAPVAEQSPVFLIVAAVTLALYWSAGLYPGYRVYPHERLRRRAGAILKVAAVCVVVEGLIAGSWMTAGILAAFLALALALQPFLAAGTRRVLHGLGLWGETVDILADPRTRDALAGYFAQNIDLGINPDTDAAASPRPSTVLVAQPLVGDQTLRTLREAYDSVILLADMPDIRLVGLKAADLRGEVGLCLSGTRATRGEDLLRRAIDLAIALPALVCFAPLIAASAVAVWIVDPGPVFYRQPREGRDGRTVRVLKLRTMYQDADARLEALLATDPDAKAEWLTYFKLRNDPRVLPYVGNFLRSSSCDELPQFVNVIAGEMSIVGPRPFPYYHLAAMPAEFRERRASVSPGLTGLWQITARSEADVEQQQQLDEFYIDNRSLWLDASIILGTFAAVLRRSGAY